ncbi:hypothetical protein [Aestuariivirga sp.]|uniref:hypothetical protein n=1 Tax=Aestuariivirga sp. TaxID=2650926 RepID=UPI0039E304FC
MTRRKADKIGRSKGTLAKFVGLEIFLLDSPAFDSLGLCARQAYVEIARLYNGRNNGSLALSARGLAQRLHVSKATAGRALSDLEARGFIECVKAAGFNLKSGARRAAEWRMTRYRCDVTGSPPTNAFMRWRASQKHFTVSPQAHSGLTTGPLRNNVAEKGTAVGTTRDRNGVLGGQSGLTTGPHLDICHVPTRSLHAQQGAANQKASAPASVNSPNQLDTFTTIHGAALRSLAELSDLLPADLQSWKQENIAPSQQSKFAHAAE